MFMSLRSAYFLLSTLWCFSAVSILSGNDSATARALEKDDIINNPTIHGLFGENTIEDVRIGVPMMRKSSEGKLLFDFQIQASDDLKNWTTLDTPEYEVIPSSDKEF